MRIGLTENIRMREKTRNANVRGSTAAGPGHGGGEVEGRQPQEGGGADGHSGVVVTPQTLNLPSFQSVPPWPPSAATPQPLC